MKFLKAKEVSTSELSSQSAAMAPIIVRFLSLCTTLAVFIAALVVRVVPPNSVGIYHGVSGLTVVPAGKYVVVPPWSSLHFMVTALDTDHKVGMRAKTGDFRVVEFPDLAIDNEIVGNYKDLYVNYVMDKNPIERRNADVAHVPEEKMIFKHLQPILNMHCKDMTSSTALQLSTWDARFDEITGALQARVPKGVKIHGVRVVGMPRLAVANATGPAVESFLGHLGTGWTKRMFKMVGA